MRATILTLTLLGPLAAAQHHHHGLGSASHVVFPPSRVFGLAGAGDPVALEGVRAHVRIDDGRAATTLEVALRNPAARPAEAVLLLPVPERASIVSFEFEGPAREPTARLLPRDEARRLYDSIVAQTRDPALLEFAGWQAVRTSVFPVPAHGTQRVRLVYEQLLEVDGDRFDYRLPRSVFPTPGTPWQITAEVRSSSPIAAIYSPSHDLAVTRTGPGRATATLTGRGAAEPGPLLLSVLVRRDDLTASLYACPDPRVGGGWFLLLAGLPDQLPDRPVRREVTLVLDRSGSMAGGKMEQARAAALQVLEGLDAGEWFNVIDYATTVSSFAPRPVRKDRPTLHQAREYLAALRPSGGTNLHDALLEALRPEPAPGTLPLVLFLTDGLPTVGTTSEAAIRQLAERGNRHGRRVFTFGVGFDVNVPLLDRIAETTRARSTFVQPKEDVEVRVEQVFRRLRGPALAAPELTALDAGRRVTTRAVRELIPARLPDLFEGDQLVVLGQYGGEEPLHFHLAGDFRGRRRAFEFRFDLSAASTRNSFVPRLWASRRIALLVDELRQAGANGPVAAAPGPGADPRLKELVDEIVRLSTEFGVLTEYTAFLATEGTDLGDWRRLVETCGGELDRRAVQNRSGGWAVAQGRNVQAQRDQSCLNAMNRYLDENQNQVEITGVQQVCDRGMFQRGNRWIDGRLVAARAALTPHRVVELGTPEHARLVDALVAEGRQALLSLAGEVLIAGEDGNVLVRNVK